MASGFEKCAHRSGGRKQRRDEPLEMLLLWIEATPDGAAARYYMLGMLRTGPVDSGQVNTTGRMVDHVVRTPDGWRIKRRELTMDRPMTPPDLV